MSANKITVPQSVANAIAHYVALADSKHEAFTDILSLGYEAEKSELILRHFDGDYDLLMEALICGYEVAVTPEDRLREYFGELYRVASNYDPGRRQYEAESKADAVLWTLELLGIKISGVNAP